MSTAIKHPGTLESCTCKACVKACQNNPGWMTPAEARAAIQAGYAGRLMRDWWDGEPKVQTASYSKIYVLCPASLGFGGEDAPDMPDDFLSAMYWTKGRCTFLTSKNRCEIHTSGFKPMQCRDSLPGDGATGSENKEIMALWDTEEGQRALDEWSADLERSPA